MNSLFVTLVGLLLVYVMGINLFIIYRTQDKITKLEAQIRDLNIALNDSIAVFRQYFALNKKEGRSLEVREIAYPYGFRANIVMSHPYFWQSVVNGEWEKETFELFHRYIRNTTTYVGFGEWIGPTILFAAHIAASTYGMEPDPVAFSILEQNAELNPRLPIKVSRTCISDRTSVMYMVGRADSMTRFTGVLDRKEGEREFPVNCTTLPLFLSENKISSQDLFIKMDTEGAEVLIVPSLYEWLLSIPPPRPSLYISLHSTFRVSSPEVRFKFMSVLRMYRYASLTVLTESQQIAYENRNAAALKENDICDVCCCEILVTDLER